jgi:hypothetical protein
VELEVARQSHQVRFYYFLSLNCLCLLANLCRECVRIDSFLVIWQCSAGTQRDGSFWFPRRLGRVRRQSCSLFWFATAAGRWQPIWPLCVGLAAAAWSSSPCCGATYSAPRITGAGTAAGDWQRCARHCSGRAAVAPDWYQPEDFRSYAAEDECVSDDAEAFRAAAEQRRLWRGALARQGGCALF